MKNKKGLTVFIIFLIVIILLGSANKFKHRNNQTERYGKIKLGLYRIS